jgi:hypothetical protein
VTADAIVAPESFDGQRRSAQPHARLFPFLGRKVRTPDGPGTLLQVFADRVTVVLDADLSRCSFFTPSQIGPISLGHRAMTNANASSLIIFVRS